MVVWTKAPLVPVIVSVKVPVDAVLEGATVRVTVPEPVTVVLLNRACVPDPNPLKLRVTVPANPFNAVTVTVYEPWLPRATVRLAGVAEIEKSATAEEFTTSVTVAVWTVAPLVPVMVIVDVPTGVVPSVVTVKVEDPDVVTDVGLKVAVAPVGNPLAVKVTVPVKPFRAVIVAV